RRRHTRFDCDWSSDVCSSDLTVIEGNDGRNRQHFSPCTRINAAVIGLRTMSELTGMPGKSCSPVTAPINLHTTRTSSQYLPRCRSEERRVGKEGRTLWEAYAD